jgi:3-hydroxymyristoyl/3-hydroxydecanoyl-(acyl carrier protein) dehydratase
MAILKQQSLKSSTVVVTGGSRDIGGGIVLELANAGATVCSVFRSHTDRAQKIVDAVKNKGIKPILLQADLTTEAGKTQLFDLWLEKFGNKINSLILCASGATMEINVDANVALIDKFLAIRKKQIKKGEEATPATIIFLQSEPGHYQRVIDGVFDFIAYYRDKVGPAKRAGEDAFRDRLKVMEEVQTRGIVVCPPEVTDTFNMKLFELQNPQAREKSRELSAKLGTLPFVTIAEVAKRVREILENPSIPNGHIEMFGGVTDGLTKLSAIYGDEAIYVHSFEKIGQTKGTGRMIVNPDIWKRDAEPSYIGELKTKKQKQLIIALKVSKDHMKGHFRPDIASLLPGHKSVRTAGFALGRFLSSKIIVDPQKVYLSKYKSVKFRSPVLPGQTLTIDVTCTKTAKDSVEGNAITSVNGKESMEIRGMTVKSLKPGKEESVLLLDQLVEAAAQTVGMYVMDNLQDDNVLPLFHGTGEAELLKSIQAGDNLLLKTGEVKLIQSKTMNIFTADLQIYRDFTETKTEEGNQKSSDKGQLSSGKKVIKEELVAEIKSLTGLLLPKKEVLDKLI